MPLVEINVAEDESQLFGHALITFPRRLGTSSQLRLSITRRSQDTPHLGEGGWQARPATVEAKVVGRTDSATTVVVGPEICGRIPVDQQVKIEADGHDVWGNAFWPPITADLPEWRGEIAPPPPPRAPAQLPEHVVERPAPPPPIEQAKPVSPPPPVSPPVPSVPKKRKSYLYLWLLLLMLAAGGVYAGSDRIIIAWEDYWEESLAARFERLKLTDDDGDELFALSSEAYAEGNRDIGFGALTIAVERGNDEAKLELARLYDPRFFDQAKIGAPDANKAARAYFELSIEGNAEATDLLASLCAESLKEDSPYADQFIDLLRSTYCVGNISQ